MKFDTLKEAFTFSKTCKVCRMPLTVKKYSGRTSTKRKIDSSRFIVPFDSQIKIVYNLDDNDFHLKMPATIVRDMSVECCRRAPKEAAHSYHYRIRYGLHENGKFVDVEIVSEYANFYLKGFQYTLNNTFDFRYTQMDVPNTRIQIHEKGFMVAKVNQNVVLPYIPLTLVKDTVPKILKLINVA